MQYLAYLGTLAVHIYDGKHSGRQAGGRNALGDSVHKEQEIAL